MNKEKENFIQALQRSTGIVTAACDAIGISRETYRQWRLKDAEFARAADDVLESQVDHVESKLLQKINDGDTTAIIFYLKTKGKSRGYTEKAQAVLPAKPAALIEQTTAASETGKGIERKIESKRKYIIQLLKKQGKYTAELSMQVTVAARLLVRGDMLAEEIFSDGHKTVNVEYSREGNERESISPKEKLLLEVSRETQKALQALGMNTNAKERRTDGDNFADFLNEFKHE